MQRPNIVTCIYDHKDDVTYKVVAYRKLTHDEAVRAIQNAFATHKIKMPGRAKVSVLKSLRAMILDGKRSTTISTSDFRLVTLCTLGLNMSSIVSSFK